jgi:hypothetical protein
MIPLDDTTARVPIGPPLAGALLFVWVLFDDLFLLALGAVTPYVLVPPVLLAFGSVLSRRLGVVRGRAPR